MQKLQTLNSALEVSLTRGLILREQYSSRHRSLSLIKAAVHDLTLTEVALRWLSRHSELKKGYGDAVIIGASSKEHIEQNLPDLEKGPLRECSLVLRV